MGFKVPYECDFITKNIKNDLIYRSNRNSDTERLEYFFGRLPVYSAELKHRQKIS